MGSLPHIEEDCMGVLQLFSDGTVFRSTDIKFPIPTADEKSLHDQCSVVFKDVLFDKVHNLHLRLYKPKLTNFDLFPIVYFIHGGGFCVGSRLWPTSHDCCLRLASQLGVLFVALDYRLAPENRLPAAMDDAVRAVEWLREQATSGSECDAWLSGVVDFDRVFVMGDSSGGNVAHHLAVRFGLNSVKLAPVRIRGYVMLAPVRIRGYVMLAPFFGGMDRTKSEEGPNEKLMDLEALDRFWRLSLLIGENRDHPFANPFGPSSVCLKAKALDPILVIVGGSEMLRDRVEDYAKRLKEMGKKVDYVEFEGQEHGFFTYYPYSQISIRLIQLIKSFLLRN